LTNNISETIHNKIANHLPNSKITKINFKDTIKYILKSYALKKNQIITKDNSILTLLIIIEKYNINNSPKFIKYDIFKKKLEFTIVYMTGNETISIIDEIISTIYELEKDGDLINYHNIKNIKKEELESIEEINSDNNNSVEEEISKDYNIETARSILNIDGELNYIKFRFKNGRSRNIG